MLLGWLRQNRRLLLLPVCCAVSFYLVFTLYELPGEAVGYAALLSAVAMGVPLCVDYARYVRRCRDLLALRGRATLSVEGMPPPEGALEEEYQALVEEVRAALRETGDGRERDRREASDYYTLWAHQIKTPISALYLLLQQPTPPEASKLRAEVFRIERYTDMALNYTRLCSDSTDLVLRYQELDGIVRSCLRQYASMFIMQRLPVDFRETRLRVLTDERWLSFVIGQLLSNSLKYTREGRVTLRAEGSELIIEDTGIGIAPEDLPRVFERGFAGYNGREDRKSTGLGLYLARRACNLLGHGLKLESVPAQGTRARIQFHDDGILYE